MEERDEQFRQELELLSEAAIVSAERTAELNLLLRSKRDQAALSRSLVGEVARSLDGRTARGCWIPVKQSEYWIRADKRFFLLGRPVLFLCPSKKSKKLPSSLRASAQGLKLELNSRASPDTNARIRLDPHKPRAGALLLFHSLAEQICDSF